MALWPFVAAADPYRFATYSAPLSREGPGLLLRDIQERDDPQIAAVVAAISDRSPDVLVLTDFDYDLDGLALAAFADLFGGLYPHRYAARPNSGMPTGLAVDRDGRQCGPCDTQGYGRFSGDGGMAVLSRYPISHVVDYSDILWRDLPGAFLPSLNDVPYLAADLVAVQRLSSTAHWVVRVDLPDGPADVLAFAATPPVFDGPEDRNGRRNRDELRLWENLLDGKMGARPDYFVLAGNANLDPAEGEGDNAAMAAFLARPDLHDPLPDQDTADWPEQDGPGNLRVSYVLPSAEWQIEGAGVFWPAPDDPSWGDGRAAAGPHHLVWVDVSR